MKVRMIRNSEIQTYKACRQKWQWGYEEGLTGSKRSALAIGSMVHKALEIWYPVGRKRGPHPATTVETLWNEHLRDGGEEFYVKVSGVDDEAETDADGGIPAIELMRAMMRGYVDLYGTDDHLEVLAPEQTFQVDVFTTSGRYVATAVGTIDLVVRDRRTRRIGFMEHKTGASLSPFGAPEPLDEQSGMYWTYGPAWLVHTGQMKPKDEIDFIDFNRLRKALPDPRPRNAQGQALNQNGTVSKKQPPPLFGRSRVWRSDEDRRSLDYRFRAVAREMDLVRSGKLAVYKNPDRHCGYCEFRDMCEVHESGGDVDAMKSMFTTWDPYEDHRGKDRVKDGV